ncbi:MAG TPA: DUF3040 domain-containing protein [Amycolatopsis sp.]|nr:DUF3040 domain-containing protein [Amycolatopsis sp.]
MALHDYEQRKLDEIEQHLAEESPRLAQHLSDFRPGRYGTLVAAALGLLILLSVGLVVMVTGVQLAAPGLIVTGALLTAIGPGAAAWYSWRRSRSRRDAPE